jgi:lactate dehydrogenase-like 2-hydroxyacid dehydrogenase
MKIHLIEPLNVEQKVISDFIPEIEKLGFEFKQWKDRKEDTAALIERCKDADVVIVSNIPFTKEIIEACPNLKMLSVAFTGVDHIDMKTCRERNIVVSNAAGYSTQSVAELTIGLMISLLRKIPNNERKLRNLHGRDGFTGGELHGKTIGIIGAGAIGQAVGKICKLAFGCEVLYFNRSKKQVEEGQFVSKKELLQRSDIVSLHVPLNSESKGMIGEEELAIMKPTALLINTARGPVVDTHALVQALTKDSIAGAAIDMYELEPPLPKDHEILSAPNTVLMPHIAYATKEAFILRAKIVFENILKWHAGEPQNVQ